MKIRITADEGEQFRGWVLSACDDSEPLAVDTDWVVVDLDSETVERWLKAQEAWEAIQVRAGEIYTAYAPKDVGCRLHRVTRWGNDKACDSSCPGRGR